VRVWDALLAGRSARPTAVSRGPYLTPNSRPKSRGTTSIPTGAARSPCGGRRGPPRREPRTARCRDRTARRRARHHARRDDPLRALGRGKRERSRASSACRTTPRLRGSHAASGRAGRSRPPQLRVRVGTHAVAPGFVDPGRSRRRRARGWNRSALRFVVAGFQLPPRHERCRPTVSIGIGRGSSWAEGAAGAGAGVGLARAARRAACAPSSRRGCRGRMRPHDGAGSRRCGRGGAGHPGRACRRVVRAPRRWVRVRARHRHAVRNDAMEAAAADARSSARARPGRFPSKGAIGIRSVPRARSRRWCACASSRPVLRAPDHRPPGDRSGVRDARLRAGRAPSRSRVSAHRRSRTSSGFAGSERRVGPEAPWSGRRPFGSGRPAPRWEHGWVRSANPRPDGARRRRRRAHGSNQRVPGHPGPTGGAVSASVDVVLTGFGAVRAPSLRRCRSRCGRGRAAPSAVTQLAFSAVGPALAIGGPGGERGRSAAVDRVVLGTAFGCFLTNAAYQRRFAAGDPRRRARDSSRPPVSNAAAGELAIAYRLGGPVITPDSGRHRGSGGPSATRSISCAPARPGPGRGWDGRGRRARSSRLRVRERRATFPQPRRSGGRGPCSCSSGRTMRGLVDRVHPTRDQDLAWPARRRSSAWPMAARPAMPPLSA